MLPIKIARRNGTAPCDQTLANGGGRVLDAIPESSPVMDGGRD
jgi:hypothetical protein